MMRKLLSSAALGALSTVATGAYAQTAKSTEHGDTTLAEIIVTAQRRDERLQDVPVAVTAFNTEMRENKGLITAQDLMNFTPGVSYSTTNDRVSIRGIGRLTNTIGSDPGVAVYYDGFYSDRLGGLGGSTLFIDRVEILRGPQGTLYGRNSVGGAINVISRRPDATLEAEIRGTIGSYDRKLVEARISGPLSDRIRASLGLSRIDQSDGYFKNSAGPSAGGVEDGMELDAQVSFDVTESFDLWLRYQMSESDNRPKTSNLVTAYDVTNPTLGGQAPNPLYLYDVANPGVADVRDIAQNRPASQKVRDVHFVTGEANWRTDFADFKYVGGYSTFESDSDDDADVSARGPFLFPFDVDLVTPGIQSVPGLGVTLNADVASGSEAEKTAWSHELNVSSNGDGPLSWIGGLYYYRENYDQAYHVRYVGQPQLLNPIVYDLSAPSPAFAPIPAAPNPTADVYAYTANLRTTSQAAYGQLNYDFSPQWHLTAGLRYSKDTKEGFESNRIILWLPQLGLLNGILGQGFGQAWDISNTQSLMNLSGIGPIQPTISGPRQRSLEGSWDGWSGTLGVEWTANEDTLVYGRYARGLKSGGFNLGSIADSPRVEEETVDSYELGWKQQVARTLTINSAVFLNKYDGAQVPVTVVVGPGAILPRFVNIPQSTSYGLETEAVFRPIEGLELAVNYAYLNAKIDNGCCYIDSSTPAAGGQDVGGNTLPASPEHKVGLNASYTFAVAAGDLTLSATYNWRSETYYDIFESPKQLAPAYDLTDFRVVWRQEAGHITVIGAVRNAFDEVALDQVTTLAPDLGGRRTIGILPPRIYSLELQYRF